MAGSDTIALNFKLSGEDDFKRALTDINNQLKVNQSELSLTSTKYSENSKSLQALTEKGKLLKTELSEENEKISTLKEGINKATSAHAAAGQQIEKLKNQLAEAKAKMDEMNKSTGTSKDDLLKQQNAIKDLNKQLKDAETAYSKTGKNTTNWSTQLNKSQKNVIELNKQIDENDKKLKKVDVDTNTFSGKMATLDNKISDTDEKLGGGLTKSIEAFGVAAVAAGGLAVKSFLDFDEQMTKVKTIADNSVVSMDELQNSILKISSATAQSADDVAGATYDALSAGVKTADVEKFMSQAAETSVAGFTDVGTSVDILTTIINAYGLQAKDATSVSDKLLLTQEKGKTTINDLGSDLGKLTGTSANANVSLNEVLAAVAALTAGGLHSSEAITGLKAAISNIIKPTTEASNEAKQLHIQFNAAALKSKGLSGVLKDVENATGGSADKMALLFGSTEALNVAMSLTGGSSQTFSETLANMNNTAGMTDKIFNNISSQTGYKFKQSLEVLKDTAIEVGDKLTPLINLLSGIITIIGKIPAPVLIAVASIITAISATVKIITTIDKLANMGGTLGQFFSGINVNSLKTTAIILGVVAALIALAAIIAVIIGKSNEMNQSLSNIGSTVASVKNSAMSTSSTAASSVKQASTSSLPKYATGTTYHPGGRALVGENGPEIVDLPAGSRVYPNGTMPSGDTYYFGAGSVVIDAHNVDDFNKVISLAKKAAQNRVKGG